MLTLPSEVKVGPYRVKVVYQDEVLDEEGRALWGCFDYDTTEIRISAGRNTETVTLVATLLHEMKHAYSWVFGQISRNDSQLLTEEDLAVHFEVAIMQMLHENPELFRDIAEWFCEESS